MDYSQYPADIQSLGNYYMNSAKCNLTEARGMDLLIGANDNPTGSIRTLLVSGGGGFNGAEIDFGAHATVKPLASIQTTTNTDNSGKMSILLYDSSEIPTEVLTLSRDSVSITGNLIIQGSTTQINVADVITSDISLRLGCDMTSLGALDGAGILTGSSETVLDANDTPIVFPSIYYSSMHDSWMCNKGFTVQGATTFSNMECAGSVTAASVIASPYSLSAAGLSGANSSMYNLTYSSSTGWTTPNLYATQTVGAASFFIYDDTASSATLTAGELRIGEYTYTDAGITHTYVDGGDSVSRTIQHYSASDQWEIANSIVVGPSTSGSVRPTITDAYVIIDTMTLGASSIAWSALSLDNATGLTYASGNLLATIAPNPTSSAWDITGDINVSSSNKILCSSLYCSSATYSIDSTTGFHFGDHVLNASGISMYSGPGIVAYQLTDSTIQLGTAIQWSATGMTTTSGKYGFDETNGWYGFNESSTTSTTLSTTQLSVGSGASSVVCTASGVSVTNGTKTSTITATSMSTSDLILENVLIGSGMTLDSTGGLTVRDSNDDVIVSITSTDGLVSSKTTITDSALSLNDLTCTSSLTTPLANIASVTIGSSTTAGDFTLYGALDLADNSSVFTIGDKVNLTYQGLFINTSLTDSTQGCVISEDLISLEGVSFARVLSTSSDIIVHQLGANDDDELVSEDNEYAVLTMPSDGILRFGTNWRIFIDTSGAMAFQYYSTTTGTWVTKLLLQ